MEDKDKKLQIEITKEEFGVLIGLEMLANDMLKGFAGKKENQDELAESIHGNLKTLAMVPAFWKLGDRLNDIMHENNMCVNPNCHYQPKGERRVKVVIAGIN